MRIVILIGLPIIILAASVAFPQEPAYVGSIICYSDSVSGTEMAEAAAKFLLAEGQEKYFSKAFVVSSMEEEGTNRYLILILSDEGQTEFDKNSAPFKKNMRPLLAKMKRRFGDSRVSVVLQLPDKTNLFEASFDDAGATALKDFREIARARAKTPEPTPAADTTFKLP